MKKLFRQLFRAGPRPVPPDTAEPPARSAGRVRPGSGLEPEVEAFQDVADLSEVQRIQDAFAASSRLALALTGPEGYALTRPSGFSTFCRLVRKADRGRKLCLRSERQLHQKVRAQDGPMLWTCQSAGLLLACLPVRLKGRHLATWILGQARSADAGEAGLERLVQGAQVDPDRVLQAYRDLPRLDGDALLAKTRLLRRLSQQLIDTGLEQLRLRAEISSLERSVWELKGYQEHLVERLEECKAALRSRERSLEELAVTDGLTGCYNRRSLITQLGNELNRTWRYGHCLSLAMGCLDGLRRINERYGEQAGDEALQAFARMLQGGIRGGTDWLARYDGSRFVLVLPETDQAPASKVLERLSRKIGTLRIPLVEDGLELSASFGLCTGHPSWTGRLVSPETFITCARSSLEQAQRRGPGGFAAGYLT